MPIRELTRYVCQCDQCGRTETFDATQPIDLPEGWEIDRDGVQYAHLIRCYCPACSEQRKDERTAISALAPEPAGDAEFEDALDTLALSVRMMHGPTLAEGSRMVFPLDAVNEPCVVRRRAVIDLHRRERMRGLAELKEWGYTMYMNSTDDEAGEAFRLMGAKIDAMLEEAK